VNGRSSLAYRLVRFAGRRALGSYGAKRVKGKIDSRARERLVRGELQRWMPRRDARRVARVYVHRRFPRDQVFHIQIHNLDIEIPLRSGTADCRDVYDSLVRRAHLPPEGLCPATIVDAGLCTGLTLYDLAHLQPSARIVGIEPQPYYAELCRRISRRYGDRVEVVEAALGPDDDCETVLHVQNGEEYAASVLRSPLQALPTTRQLNVRMISLNRIVNWLGRIDFLKLDIEGAERDVLRRNTEWSTRTRFIKVEVHPGYEVHDCISDLTQLGFEAMIDQRYSACVIGARGADARN
jgi:FkbM family methyltransferase